MLFPKQTINFSGNLMELDNPFIMGIINVTPDSFYAQSRFEAQETIIDQASKMINEGASILDIGGMSSRPGAQIISSEEEIKRVIPAINNIKDKFPEVIISIDTLHSQVAIEAVAAGASMINDISAGSIDDKMFDAVAKLDVPYVLMHMKKTPKDMQASPDYENVAGEIFDFLAGKLYQLRERGVKDVIIDPGFGFGKTIEQNYELLRKLHVFKIMEAPIMVGLSRKSMIYKPLNTQPQEALNGTTVLHTFALEQGAKILRVHDVRAAKECITLWQHYNDIKQ